MIKCIIVDDEQDAIDVLTHYISQTPLLCIVDATTNPLEELQIFAAQPVQLIFLNIKMPQLSGKDFIKAIDSQVKVVLITAYSEFAVEAYDLEVEDYLLKPIPLPLFLSVVQRAAKQLNEPNADDQASEEDYIFVKTESKSKLGKLS